MKVRNLKAEHYTRQPWKNGGGFSTELDRGQTLFRTEKESDPGLRFAWRLSIARIERPGPFSDFAGYERTIMLLAGNGMELDFDHVPTVRIDRPEAPFVFDGGWKTHCRLLGGPVQALNLIVDRESTRATLRVMDLSREPAMLIAASQALYYVLCGKAAFGILGLDQVVATGELLRIDDAKGFPIPASAAEADTAIVEIGITRR